MKWFAVDMDGTFLNDDRQVSPDSGRVIKKLQKKGIKFLICTGRVDLAVKHYYEDIGLDDVTVSCNGTLIRNLKTGEIIYENTLSNEQVKIIYDIYKKYCTSSTAFHLYTKNYVYGEKVSTSIARMRRIEKNLEDRLKTPIIVDENILSAVEKNGDEIHKVMLESTDHDIFKKIYDEVSTHFDTYGAFSAKNYFDIIPADCNKGEGLKKVAKHYGLDMKDLIVFGDNTNDLEMLQVAGYSICPENAKEEVKKYCDEVIGNNNDFSVIKYIEKYVDSLGD